MSVQHTQLTQAQFEDLNVSKDWQIIESGYEYSKYDTWRPAQEKNYWKLY